MRFPQAVAQAIHDEGARHLLTEELPADATGKRFSNSDPVTGQAGWYDVRVRIYAAAPDEAKESWPQFPAMPALPGTGEELYQGLRK